VNHPRTTAPDPAHARAGALPRRATIALALGAAFLGAGVLVTLGQGADGVTNVLLLIDRSLVGVAVAGAYLGAAAGFGVLLRPLLRDSHHPALLAWALGAALLLWLSHLLAWLGVFGGSAGPWIALATLLVGLALAGVALVRRLRGDGVVWHLHPLGVFAGVGAAVLVAACANPPGALWESEFAGYDVLSYHLQLPREWLEAGRLAPLPHNVYSFLPGYVEGAFMHVGAALFEQPSPDAPVLVAGMGRGAYAAQFLHAGFVVLGALLTGALAGRVARRSGIGEPAARCAGAFAGALVLVTPWAVVTGSLAYNDMAALALLAGAALAGADDRVPGFRRGLVAGLLLGAAASVKPTALLLGAPLVGALALWTCPPRAWARLVLAGTLAGLVMTLPWLVRNFLASGNPVFPFAASIFANDLGGTGHWSAEQVARYGAGHRFEGGLFGALRLLVLPDPTDPAGVRHRGAMHPQWGWVFPLALVALVAGLATRRTHIAAFALGAALIAQLLAWALLTHVQSRFLIPLLPTAAALGGLALAGACERARVPRVGALLAAGAVLLAQGVMLVSLYASQRGGAPNLLFAGGTRLRTGEGVREELERVPRDVALDWAANAPPEAFVNALVPRGARVYLLGSGAPLYVRGPVTYNTTWDAWLFGEAAEHAARPATDARAFAERVSAHLRDAGVEFVLVDLGEIQRLTRSGWIDPRVRADDVLAWMRGSTILVRAWDEVGIYLVRPIVAGEMPGAGAP
jgi:hypothetical protein